MSRQWVLVLCRTLRLVWPHQHITRMHRKPAFWNVGMGPLYSLLYVPDASLFCSPQDSALDSLECNTVNMQKSSIASQVLNTWQHLVQTLDVYIKQNMKNCHISAGHLINIGTARKYRAFISWNWVCILRSFKRPSCPSHHEGFCSPAKVSCFHSFVYPSLKKVSPKSFDQLVWKFSMICCSLKSQYFVHFSQNRGGQNWENMIWNWFCLCHVIMKFRSILVIKISNYDHTTIEHLSHV